MALSKEVTVIEKAIVMHQIIQVKEQVRVLEDGNELSSNYHRYTVVPGQDLTGLPDDVVALSNYIHTPEVIAAYEAVMLANTEALAPPV